MERVGSRTYIMAVMIVMALAILLLRLMHKRVMPLIDRYFFREAYDAQQILSELGQAVRTVTNVEQLLELVATKVQAALHTENVTIFLRDEVTGDYVPAISSAHVRRGGVADAAASDVSITLVLTHNALTAELLRESSEPLTIDFHDPQSWVQALLLKDAPVDDSHQREI